jgi:3-oxoadipate enol-lactonase
MSLGLQTSLLTWKFQVEYFVTDPERRYQVLILDNRGYGHSDRPSKLYSTHRMAKDAYSVIKNQLKWNHYHLVGQSMGGMIATELALLDMRSLLSLALVVTHAGGLSSFPPVCCLLCVL